ncbi:MAG: ammonium transporter [Saprospiraceae bacterium]|nr:ammonium transporter [Saprospiraceae bacterium]
MKNLNKLFFTGLLLITPFIGQAQDSQNAINSGDTAWMLISTALVMLMTPAGLALFYGGLSNKKAVINTVGMSYVAFIVATLVWVTFGYSIAFGNANIIWGGSDHFMLKGITVNDVTGTIPTILFVCFQGVFAAIAVAIISGSLIERIKFSTWMIFSTFWVLLVYAPLVHWVWGEGILSTVGELDFAGGTVIHVNAGVAGLVAALLLGKRKNAKIHESRPSSLKLTLLGSALLWFGWFGFNAGSQVAADGIAANAFLVTNVAACAGGLGWILFEWSKHSPSMLGVSSGVISGLVGITPASGYVDVSGALAIGLTSGIVGYFGVMKLKSWLKYDDTLDAFGIHGLVGIWGSLATGLFANPAINGEAGWFYGNSGQFWAQLIAVLVTILFSAIGTAVIFWLSSLITKGGRVDEVVEEQGIDYAFHKETSFAHEESPTG